jgi:hypothetical protein
MTLRSSLNMMDTHQTHNKRLISSLKDRKVGPETRSTTKASFNIDPGLTGVGKRQRTPLRIPTYSTVTREYASTSNVNRSDPCLCLVAVPKIAEARPLSFLPSFRPAALHHD